MLQFELLQLIFFYEILQMLLKLLEWFHICCTELNWLNLN